MLYDVIVLKYFLTWAFSFWHIISINDHDIYTKDLEVTLVPELKVLTCLISVAFVISEVLVYLLNYDVWLLMLWHIHFYKFLNFKVWNFFQPQGNSKADEWVETYTIQTSTDGVHWTDYDNDGHPKVSDNWGQEILNFCVFLLLTVYQISHTK